MDNLVFLLHPTPGCKMRKKTPPFSTGPFNINYLKVHLPINYDYNTNALCSRCLGDALCLCYFRAAPSPYIPVCTEFIGWLVQHSWQGRVQVHHADDLSTKRGWSCPGLLQCLHCGSQVHHTPLPQNHTGHGPTAFAEEKEIGTGQPQGLQTSSHDTHHREEEIQQQKIKLCYQCGNQWNSHQDPSKKNLNKRDT